MFHNPLSPSFAEYRRRQCAAIVLPALHLIVERLHRSGWGREEILVAIGDAADRRLCDITDDGPTPSLDKIGPVSHTCRKPVKLR